MALNFAERRCATRPATSSSQPRSSMVPRAPFDAVVQRGARGLQADLDRVVAFQGRAARPVNFRERAPRKQANFDRANHLGAVAGTDAQCRFRIEPPQDAVQILQAVRVGSGFEARAQFLRARRGVGQAFEQSAQIQPGPDRQDGEPRALAQIFQDGNRPRAIFARREWEARVHQVQQVMRNAAAFLECGLGRANIKPAIDLRGIAGQDIAASICGPAPQPARICRTPSAPRWQ